MKSHDGYLATLIVGGIICTFYFTMMLQNVPELSAQLSEGNKTGNDIIMHTHSSLNVTVNGNSLLVFN